MLGNKQHSRRIGRSKAFQVLYSLHFTQITTLETLQEVFLTLPNPTDSSDCSNIKIFETQKGFSWEIVEGVWRNTHELDSIISQFSQNWRVDRLGKIELTLLRIATFEMLYRPDVPPKVALNEALELAACFGDSKAKKFINGILDATIKALEAGMLNPTESRSSNL